MTWKTASPRSISSNKNPMKKSQLKEIIANVIAEKLLEAKGQPSKFGYIVSGKRSPDPVVQMTGYGNMPLSSWKRKVVRDVEDLLKQVKNESWHNARYLLQPDGILATELNMLHDLFTPNNLKEQLQDDPNVAANPPVPNREAEELRQQQQKISDVSMEIKKLEANIERRSQPVKRANDANERKISNLRRKQGPLVRKIDSLKTNLDKKP